MARLSFPACGMSALFSLMCVGLLPSCSRFGAVYPSRPPSTPGAPVADPAPARLVAHVTVTGPALQASLDREVPRTGEGTVPLVGSERRYTWEREPLAVTFSQGRLVLETRIHAKVSLPLTTLEFPLDLHIVAEPVVNTNYAVRLQSIDVKVTSTDRRLRAADYAAGLFDSMSARVTQTLRDFSYSLRPTIDEAYARVSQPIDIPGLGEAKGCAELRVLGVEAGPTVVADGLEKDLALVVAPSVELPCPAPTPALPMPPLANVATLVPGPFTVTIPLAARYDELTRAMALAFTVGKLFFSSDYPKLYLEKPEVYESEGRVVLKVHLTGPVHKFGIDADLDGDLFLAGHPTIVDNELEFPDLEPTIETSNFLLSLKAMTDTARIRDQARAALRLDIGERLKSVREKLADDLTFGNAEGCFQGSVDKIEVTSVHAHQHYLRLYVAFTGRAAVSVPCAVTLPAVPPDAFVGPPLRE